LQAAALPTDKTIFEPVWFDSQEQTDGMGTKNKSKLESIRGRKRVSERETRKET
jgi:hypothetical protein